MSTYLGAWIDRLAEHFGALANDRTDIRLFAFQHGLAEADLLAQQSGFRADIQTSAPAREHQFIWVISALSNRPVRRTVAIGGEVSLNRQVSAIGSTPQKVVAAYKRGPGVVLLPKANPSYIQRLPCEILDALDIRRVFTASEALNAALTG